MAIILISSITIALQNDKDFVILRSEIMLLIFIVEQSFMFPHRKTIFATVA